MGGGAGDGAEGALALDLAYPLADELDTDRLRVYLLQDGAHLTHVSGGNLRQHAIGVFVAGLDTLQVEDGQAAKLVEGDRRPGVDDSVHRRRDEGQGQLEVAEGKGDVGQFGVQGHVAGHNGDLVEAVGAPHLLGPGRRHGILFPDDCRCQRCRHARGDILPAGVPHCATLPFPKRIR